MNALPESTTNLLLSAIMGAISGFFTVPLNAWVLWKLKREEQDHQHKLDVNAKEKELFLQHRLEMKRIQQNDFHNEILELKKTISQIESKIEQQAQGNSNNG